VSLAADAAEAGKHPACMYRSLLALLLLTACSAKESEGHKIFVTQRQHIADFLHDPTLAGSTAIEKADAFCAGDPNRPSTGTYKALLVDGELRDAPSRRDWVLAPDTDYFLPENDVLIGRTTHDAIFAAAFQDLEHAPGDGQIVWTGLRGATDFSSGDDCDGWSNFTNDFAAVVGNAGEQDAAAFSGGLNGCFSFEYSLYCVEQ
jgi:trimeric autotransporter adhesin